MGRVTIVLVILSSWTAGAGDWWAKETPTNSGPESASAPLSEEVEAVLQKIQQATKDLRHYQCGIDYVLRQPLLESETRRTGMVYYLRKPTGSRLRVNFETLQQDDQQRQRYAEQFFFDGVWLTHVDYQVKAVKKRQMAEPNRPVDAFDLASRDLPIVGFTGTEDLRRDFDMQVVPPRSGQPSERIVTLSLEARPGSLYGKDYRTIVFDVDRTLWLPARVKAESTDGDIYDVSFVQAKVNQPLEEAVFDLKIPKDFGDPEIIPLEASEETHSKHVP